MAAPAAMDVDEEWPEDEASPSGPGLSGQLELEIAPSEDVGENGGECKVAVSIKVAAGSSGRAPSDICCVVDISGSMGELATYEQDGVTKSDGLTILDIVKHAVKTVVHTLKDEDRFALVAFDESVDRVLSLTAMTEAGRAEAIKALDGLAPRGRTNIWGGVLEGMEALRSPAHAAKGRQASLLLLTDGLPNISPPRGHVAELKDYKERFPDFGFQISTFGFGYSLDSDLLLGLAIEGHGTYAFIPDAVIVGTVFVNSVANALSSLTQDATLHLTPKNGSKFTGPSSGDYAETEATWGRVVSLGPLQLGQAREVVVPLNIPAGAEPYLDATVVFNSLSGKEERANASGSQRTATQISVAATARCDTVSIGYKAVTDASEGRGKSAQQAVQGLAQRFVAYEAASLKASSNIPDARLTSLRRDVDGRMSKAMKGKERFSRWGKHYIKALCRAHQVQQCTNFMDPGLQVYSGPLFASLRDIGDQVFISLPPPKPSKAVPAVPVARPTPAAAPAPGAYAAPATYTAPATFTPPADMNTYYGGSGGG